MDKHAFVQEAEKHIEALQKLIAQMPYQGDTSEFSQKVRLSIELNDFEASVNGVEPFDFVDVDISSSDLKLVNIAESNFNADPDLCVYIAEVWFNDGDDPTTVVESYECVIAESNESDIQNMVNDFNDLLGADTDLFANIGNIEKIHPKS